MIPTGIVAQLPRVGLRAGQFASLNAAPIRELGFLSLLDGPRRELSVVVRNDGDATLTLPAPRPTCRCTRAAFEREPMTLNPGEEATLRLTLDLTVLAPGPLLKGVLIVADGDSLPLAVVNVSGELVAPVRLLPAALALEPGKSAEVVAEIDARLLTKSPVPALACSAPGVVVTPLGEPAPLRQPGPSRVRRTYRVQLAPDAAPSRATLGFRVPDSPSAAHWRAADVPVTFRATSSSPAQ